MPDAGTLIARGAVALVVWGGMFGMTAARAQAQSPSCDGRELEVRSLEFKGNKALRSSELARRIVTTPSTLKRPRKSRSTENSWAGLYLWRSGWW